MIHYVTVIYHNMISVIEKLYSSTPTIFCKLRRAFRTHSDPVVSDICCYLQPCFDEATKLFLKLGEGGSTDHCSLPVAKYKYSLPRRSCVKADGFLGQFSGLAISIHTWGLTKFLFQLQMLGYDISWAAFNIIEVMSSSKFTFKVSLQCTVFS